MMQFAKTTMIAIAAFVQTAGAANVHDEKGTLLVRTSRATNRARFVTAADGNAITMPGARGQQKPEPIDVFRVLGVLFGVTDPDGQLVFKKTATDALGHTHTTFQQVYEGVPVFASLLRAHFNVHGELMAINGTFIPDIDLSAAPVLTADDAATVALAEVTGQLERETDLTVANNTLHVFRANLARGVPGPNHLVYEVEVTNGSNVREFLYVDAHKGHVVDQITGIHEIDRKIYTGGFGPGFLVWWEGQAYPTGDVDVDHLIEYSEDVYNLIASTTNGAFLSWDGADGTMHCVDDDPGIDCPDASWNGTSTNYCPNVTGDDTVGHEWGHAYTISTHGLIYQWQPGALNEAYADIYGEIVDLLNASGTDSPAPIRLAGECSTYGGMKPPTFQINSPPGIAGTYFAGGATFNPTPPVTVTADVELVDDGDDNGGAGSITDGCQALIGFTSGRIALIDRGFCPFTDKVNHAAAAGAVGVIVVNHQGDGIFHMSGTGPLAIPSVFIGESDGGTIKTALGSGTVNATITLLPAIDNSLRWLAGEDSTGFAAPIRDMWNPNCMLDPARVGDTVKYYCGYGDQGGVHTNSGIPNHAFALLTDGGTYNGQTITSIGLTKAFHIYWRAQTVYQVPASYFSDHADALELSCTDLIGTNLNALSTTTTVGTPSGEIINTADCAQVTKAIAAVQLRLEPTFCDWAPMLEPDAPPWCAGATTPVTIAAQDWESGFGSWTVGTRDEADPATFDTPDWAVVGGLPDGRPGSAAFVADLVIGDCATDTEAGVLYLESPVINLPADSYTPRIAFTHWVATEPHFDGGNVKISVNGAAYTLIPGSAFQFNAYNNDLDPPPDNDNPMAGEEAFTGTDGGELTGSWGESQIDLLGIAAPADNIKLRFEMGLDGCNGRLGWYVDEVEVFYCTPCAPVGACEAVKVPYPEPEHDLFAGSTAVDATIAVFGAHFDDDAGWNAGAAYIYYSQGGPGNWTKIKKITGSDTMEFDDFGFAVTISGDVAVVSAIGDDNGCGATYVFYRNEGGTDNWGQKKQLVAFDAAANDRFGTSVAVDGDTIVVGANHDDDAGLGSGSAYVFERDHPSLDNWGLTAKLVPTDLGPGDAFGHSVAIEGDVIVVGAGQFQNGPGAAYVFYRNEGGANNWGQKKKLLASDGAYDHEFGISVSISGDVIMVGAQHADSPSASFCGAIYVFQRDIGGADNWGQVDKLTASDAETLDYFGYSVSVEDDVAFIGAPWDTVDLCSDTLDPCVIDDDCTIGTCANHPAVSCHKDEDCQPGQCTITLDPCYVDEDCMMFPEELCDSPPPEGCNGGAVCGIRSGSAYEYRSAGGTWTEHTKLIPSDAGEFDSFGWSLSRSNHIGIVGAWGDDCAGFEGCGSAYVFTLTGDDCNCNETADICEPTAVSGFCILSCPPPCSDGSEWSMKLDWAGAGPDFAELNCPAVPPAGSTAVDMAQGLVDCINSVVCSSMSAALVAPTTPCLNVTVPGEIKPSICVGPADSDPGCCVASGGQVCSFNPDLIGVALTGQDCNANDIDDAIDITLGSSPDENEDNVPDECLVPPWPEDSLGIPCNIDDDCDFEARCVQGVCYAPKTRYLSIRLNPQQVPNTARRVKLDDGTELGWVGEPAFVEPLQEPTGFWLATIQGAPHYETTWPDVVHVTGCKVAHASLCDPSGVHCDPNSCPEGETCMQHSYRIQAIAYGFDPGEEGNYSEVLELRTNSTWGDTVSTIILDNGRPPDGVVGVEDIMAAIKKYQIVDVAPIVWLDIADSTGNNVTDQSIGVDDIMNCIDGYQGKPYPGYGPLDCP